MNTGFRPKMLIALVILLLAPLVATAPVSASNDAAAQQQLVPEGFGTAVVQSAALSFGQRASRSAFSQLAVLQPCDATDTELVKGPATKHGVSVDPSEPGMRWRYTLCKTERWEDQRVLVKAAKCYTVTLHPYVESCEPAQYDTRRVMVGYDTTVLGTPTEIPHPDAREWIKNAVKQAVENADGLDDVVWSSSPHYNRRQVVGLNTFFAVSAQDRGPADLHGDWGPYLAGVDLEAQGAGGPDNEINIGLTFSRPHATFKFDDGVAIACENPGQLWSAATSGVDPSEPGSGLCARSWADSSVADGSVDKVKLEEVELLYDWALNPNTTNAMTVIGVLNITDTSGQIPSKRAGGQREFVIGEVQTYGVDLVSNPDNVRPDTAPLDTEWVPSRDRLCEQLGKVPVLGWFAREACELIDGLINIYATIFEFLWDGAKFVVTVVKVVFSGLWNLIKGCLGMVGDLVSGIGDIAGAIQSFIDEPGEQVQEFLGALDMIKDQLANPDTALDFVQNVLGALAFEALALHHIAVVNDDGSWSLLDDPNWTEWTGRIICEIVVAVLTGGQSKWKDLLNTTRLAQRIRRWLNRLPDVKVKPCTVKKLVNALDIAAETYEVFQLAKTAAEQADNAANGTHIIIEETESNSFPTGTLVRMADGSRQTIETISPGDEVLAWDHADEAWEAAVVTHQWSAIDDGQMATVTLDDRSSITATDGHRFWVHSEELWIDLEDLLPGDVLLTPTGTATVADVDEAAPASTLVWELTVAEHHNFAVFTGTTDVLVHNACKDRADGAGDDSDFTEDADGSYLYTGVDPPIDDIAVTADGTPKVVRTDGYTIIPHTDGTVTYIDRAGNRHRSRLNDDGTFTIPNDDYGPLTISADGATQRRGTDGPLLTTGVPPRIVKDPGPPMTTQKPRGPADTNPNFDHSQTHVYPDGSKDMVLNDGNNTVVTYDPEGFVKLPSEVDVQIPTGQASNSKDFRAANQAVRDGLADGSIPAFDDIDLQNYFTENPLTSTPPDGYTWHHHQDTGKMQLVPDTTHANTPHTGGASIWGEQEPRFDCDAILCTPDD